MSFKNKLIVGTNLLLGISVLSPLVLFTESSKLIGSDDSDYVTNVLTEVVETKFKFNKFDDKPNAIQDASIFFSENSNTYQDAINDMLSNIVLVSDNNISSSDSTTNKKIYFVSPNDLGSVDVTNIKSTLNEVKNNKNVQISSSTNQLQDSNIEGYITRLASDHLSNPSSVNDSNINEYVRYKNQSHPEIGISDEVSLYAGITIPQDGKESQEYNMCGFDDANLISNSELKEGNEYVLQTTLTFSVTGAFCISNEQNDSFQTISSDFTLPDNGYGLTTDQLNSYIETKWSKIWGSILDELLEDKTEKTKLKSIEYKMFKVTVADASYEDQTKTYGLGEEKTINNDTDFANPMYLEISYNGNDNNSYIDDSDGSNYKITGTYYMLIGGMTTSCNTDAWRSSDDIWKSSFENNEDNVSTFTDTNDFKKGASIYSQLDRILSNFQKSYKDQIVSDIDFTSSSNSYNDDNASQSLFKEYILNYYPYENDSESNGLFLFEVDNDKLMLEGPDENDEGDFVTVDITEFIFNSDSVQDKLNVNWTVSSKPINEGKELSKNDLGQGYLDRDSRGYDINYRQIAAMFNVYSDSKSKSNYYGYKNVIMSKLNLNENKKDDVCVDGIYTLNDETYQLQMGRIDNFSHSSSWYSNLDNGFKTDEEDVIPDSSIDYLYLSVDIKGTYGTYFIKIPNLNS